MAGTVEVALRWCGNREEQVQSFANSVLTPDGGTHAMGFRDGVAAAVTSYAQRRLLRATDPDLGADQIGEGLTAVVSVKWPDRPQHLPELSGSRRFPQTGPAEARIRAVPTEGISQRRTACATSDRTRRSRSARDAVRRQSRARRSAAVTPCGVRREGQGRRFCPAAGRSDRG